MIRAIATVTLSGSLAEKFDAIAEAGFRQVELVQADLDAFAGSPQEAFDLARAYGLRILVFQPLRDFEGLPRRDFATKLEQAVQMLETACALHAGTLLLCSSVSEYAVNDEQLIVQDLRILAERAADVGVRIAYEALSWGRFARFYRDAWRLVDLVDHPNFGLALDTFHTFALRDDFSGLDGIPANRIFLLQVADAPYLESDLLQWSRHHRCLPGDGDFDLRGFMGAAMKIGYDGPVSIEVFSDACRAAAPGAVAARGYRSLCLLEHASRKRLREERDALTSSVYGPYFGRRDIERKAG